MKGLKQFTALLALAAVAVAPIAGLAREKAYTVTEIREQAAQGWHKTYQTKWREVMIDVDIRVPDVDTVPVILAAAVQPQRPTAQAQAKGWNVVSYGDESHGHHFRLELKNPDYGVKGLEKLVRRGKLRHYRSVEVFRDFEDGKAYGTGNDLTLGDMKDKCREILTLAGVALDAYHLQEPSSLRGDSYVDVKTGEVAQKTQLFVSFDTQLRGIPVLNIGSTGGITLGMIDDTDWWTSSIDPLEERERLEEDIPFYPLDKVIQTLEGLITVGHIRSVLDMRLGYRLYQDKSDKELMLNSTRIYAVPMWMVECIAVKDPGKEPVITAYEREGNEDFPEEGILRGSRFYKQYLVNARTGQLYEVGGLWSSQKVDDEPERFRQEMLGQ